MNEPLKIAGFGILLISVLALFSNGSYVNFDINEPYLKFAIGVSGISLGISLLILAKIIGVLEEIRDRLPEPEFDEEEFDETEDE